MGIQFEKSNFSIEMSGNSPDAQLRMIRAMSYLMVGDPISLSDQGRVTIEGVLAKGVDYETARIFYENGIQPEIPSAEMIEPSQSSLIA